MTITKIRLAYNAFRTLKSFWAWFGRRYRPAKLEFTLKFKRRTFRLEGMQAKHLKFASVISGGEGALIIDVLNYEKEAVHLQLIEFLDTSAVHPDREFHVHDSVPRFDGSSIQPGEKKVVEFSGGLMKNILSRYDRVIVTFIGGVFVDSDMPNVEIIRRALHLSADDLYVEDDAHIDFFPSYLNKPHAR
jgi:hypothetical protein